MSTSVVKKKRLTTPAMIASIASEGQRVKAAPFGKALVQLAQSQNEIVGLTADLAKYTDLDLFAQAFPERFYQMGMAEQLLMGAAGGMAKVGRLRFHSPGDCRGEPERQDLLRAAGLDHGVRSQPPSNGRYRNDARDTGAHHCRSLRCTRH